MEIRKYTEAEVQFLANLDMFSDEVLINEAQLALIRGCSPKKIEKERALGIGVPSVKDGHLVKYRLGTVRQFLKTLENPDPAHET